MRRAPKRSSAFWPLPLTYYVVGHFHYVLSLGAVYSMFAAFYYWVGKMTGYNYSEFLGRIHFWVFTLGINFVFFPMHFLGLNGMPRRIPDYPDAYASWNSVSTLGSILTAFSLVLWLMVLSSTFSPKNGEEPALILLNPQEKGMVLA